MSSGSPAVAASSETKLACESCAGEGDGLELSDSLLAIASRWNNSSLCCSESLRLLGWQQLETTVFDFVCWISLDFGSRCVAFSPRPVDFDVVAECKVVAA